MMPTCPLCGRNPLFTEEQQARGSCDDCERRAPARTAPSQATPPCPVCGRGELATDRDRARGACPACAVRFDVPDASPAARPPVPCRRCGHRVLVRGRARARHGELGERHARLAVTFERTRGLLAGDHLDTGRPVGLLEVYVCRACGFTEWYALDPQAIPIGVEHGTELVEVGGEGPFR